MSADLCIESTTKNEVKPRIRSMMIIAAVWFLGLLILWVVVDRTLMVRKVDPDHGTRPDRDAD